MKRTLLDRQRHLPRSKILPRLALLRPFPRAPQRAAKPAALTFASKSLLWWLKG